MKKLLKTVSYKGMSIEIYIQNEKITYEIDGIGIFESLSSAEFCIDNIKYPKKINIELESDFTDHGSKLQNDESLRALELRFIEQLREIESKLKVKLNQEVVNDFENDFDF